MEEAEEGGSPMWEGAEGEDMTPVSDDVTSTADLPGSDAAFSSSDPGEGKQYYQQLLMFRMMRYHGNRSDKYLVRIVC